MYFGKKNLVHVLFLLIDNLKTTLGHRHTQNSKFAQSYVKRVKKADVSKQYLSDEFWSLENLFFSLQ